jgi:hypothetical protein
MDRKRRWPEKKLISLVPPAIPLWAISYDPENDGIWVEPILSLAIVERPVEANDYDFHVLDKEFSLEQDIVPLEFSREDGIEYWWEPMDKIGYSPRSLTEEEAREEFKEEIRQEKERYERAKQKETK